MKAIAVFHAYSLVLWKRNPELAAQWADDPLMKDRLADESFVNVTRQFRVDPAVSNLKILQFLMKYKSNSKVANILVIPDNITEDKIKKLLQVSDDLAMIGAKSRKVKGEKTELLIHGDYHMWNVAFDDTNGIVIFDMQTVNRSNFAEDLQQFMSQAVTAGLRKEKTDEFLELYSKTFHETCKALDFTDQEDLNQFTFEAVKAQYKRKTHVGYLNDIKHDMPRFVKDKEAFEKAKTLLKEDGNPGEIMALIEKFGSKFWDNLQRFFDNISEYIDHMLRADLYDIL